MIDPSLIDPGEQLIWSGNPDPIRYALRKGGYTFLIGIFFFAFSLFWLQAAYTQSAGAKNPFMVPFWMFGLPFVLVGAGLLLSPLWHFLRAIRTTYAVTDQRAIIDASGPFPRRTSVPLRQIPFVDVQSSAEGPGHVLFQDIMAGYKAIGSYVSSTQQRDGFLGISDAAKVGYLLRSAIERSGSSRLGKS